MKAVLISIRPEWCELIASGKKTGELRITAPSLRTPFKCYIYCTKSRKTKFWTGSRYSYADDHSHNQFDICGNGKVIGEFVCSSTILLCKGKHVRAREHMKDVEYPGTCLTYQQLFEYLDGTRYGHILNIDELIIYDRPKELAEFGLKRAPQSWCYVEVRE